MTEITSINKYLDQDVTMMLTDIENMVDIAQAVQEAEKDIYAKSLSLVEDFAFLYKNEKSTLPYSINLLDEIHANENAHSRIFRKLLLFSESKASNPKYPILELFLKYLGHPFDILIQDTPEITAEKMRIDLLVQDKNFAIIIENKINGAVDQDAQMQRYVECIQEAGTLKEKIYILYLTEQGGSPSESSFSQGDRHYFGNRYQEISYRHTILPFLQDKLNPWINNKADSILVEFLRTACHQYIDYLEGRFYMRKGEMKMTESLKNMLKEKMGFSDDAMTPMKKFELISDNRETINRISEYLDELEKDILLEEIAEAKEYWIQKIIPFTDTYDTTGKEFGEKKSRVRFYPKNWNKKYCVSIVFDTDYNGLFYGIENIESEEDTGELSDPLFRKIRKLLGDSDGPSNHWLFAKYIFQEGETAMSFFMNENRVEELANRIIQIAKLPELQEILKGVAD